MRDKERKEKVIETNKRMENEEREGKREINTISRIQNIACRCIVLLYMAQNVALKGGGASQGSGRGGVGDDGEEGARGAGRE